MTNTVLVFLIGTGKNGGLQVCLGRRKTAYAHGLWNAPGGKVKKDEGIFDAAVREVEEETGLRIKKENLKKRAKITYYEHTGNCFVNVFVCESWEGKLRESDEIASRWFYVDEIPFDKMWENDRLWLPSVLSGKCIKGKVWHDEQNKLIKSELKEVKLL